MADETQEPVDSRALLMEKLWSDPEAGPELDRIIKKKFPNASIPRHDAREAARGAVAEVAKVHDEFKAEVQRERDERSVRDARNAIVEAGLATRDEIPKVEEFMKERVIGTHEAAAKLWRLEQQVAQPRSVPETGWDVPGHLGAGGDEYKGIIGPDGKANPRWARAKAHEAIAELNAGKPGKWM